MVIIADSMAGGWLSARTEPDGMDSLIEKTMPGKDPGGRIAAVTALGSSRDPRALQALVDCCRDRNPEIRLQAIEGLQRMRNSRSENV